MWRTRRTQATEDAVIGGRRGRGFGPFSGGQLTIIIVTFAGLLLLPVGAWALSFTNVSIIDPGGVNRAKVNAAGQLSTDALVTGSVTARPSAAGSTFAYGNHFAVSAGVNLGPSVSGTIPAGKAAIITSVTIGPRGTLSSSVSFFVEAGNGSGNLGVGSITLNPGAQPVTLSFPSGLAIKNGHYLSIFAPTAAVNVDVSVSGYYVTATQCTPTTCY